jgi:hypothetical protein
MADITFRAFAGINNLLPAERIRSLPTQDNATCELVDAVNVDIDNSGRISRRSGTEQKVAGAAHSLWSNGDLCMFVQGNRLMQLQPDFSTNILAAGLVEDMPVCFVEAAGNIYWSNGQQSGAFVNGRGRPWGMPVPPNPGIESIFGNLTAGDYQIAMTWRRDDGEESGAGMAEKITLGDNGGLRITWTPPADPGITDACLYLTEPNGEQLYRVFVAPAANGNADITSAQLALPLNTQWLDQPPAGQCLAYHRGRIYIASGAFLYATTALGYGLCDLRDYLAVDDTTIRFLASVEHGLFVGTESAVYFLAGDKLEDLALTVAVDAPAVARSAVNAEGVIVTGDANLAGQQVAIFATALGIYVGLEDGGVINMTQAAYRFDATATGAGLFRSGDTLRQYLLFLQN